MADNVELKENGLKCDNPKCDWTDHTVKFDDLKNWINRPCPKCSENVLTLEDYQNAMRVKLWADMLNTLTEEELQEVDDTISDEDLQEILKDVQGAELLKDKDAKVCFGIETHEQIKISEIKKCDDGL